MNSSLESTSAGAINVAAKITGWFNLDDAPKILENPDNAFLVRTSEEPLPHSGF